MRLIIKSTLRSIKNNLARTIFTMLIILLVGFSLFCYVCMPAIVEDGYDITMTLFDDKTDYIVTTNYSAPTEYYSYMDAKLAGFGNDNITKYGQSFLQFRDGYEFCTLRLLCFADDMYYNRSFWDAFAQDQIIAEWQYHDTDSNGKRLYYEIIDGIKQYFIPLMINKAAHAVEDINLGDAISFDRAILSVDGDPTLPCRVAKIVTNSNFMYNSIPSVALSSQHTYITSYNYAMTGVSAQEYEQLQIDILQDLPSMEKMLTFDGNQSQDIQEEKDKMNIPLLIMVLAVVIVCVIILFNAYSVLVKNRMQEMLIFKACGATSMQITILLLTEVTILAAVFGALGAVAGRFFMQYLVTTIFVGVDFIWSSIFPWWIYVVAISISCVISFVSAFLPIYKASKLSLRESQSGEVKKMPPQKPIATLILLALLIACLVIAAFLEISKLSALMILLASMLSLAALLYYGVPLVLVAISKLAKGKRIKGEKQLARINIVKNYSLVFLSVSCVIAITFVYLVSSFFATLKTSFIFDPQVYSANYVGKFDSSNSEYALKELDQALEGADGVVKSHTIVRIVPRRMTHREDDFTVHINVLDSLDDNRLEYLNTKYIAQQTKDKFYNTEDAVILTRHLMLMLNCKVGDSIQIEDFDYTIVGSYDFDHDSDCNVYINSNSSADAVLISQSPYYIFYTLDESDNDRLASFFDVMSQTIYLSGVYPVTQTFAFGDVSDNFMQIFNAIERILYYISALMLANSILNSIVERKREYHAYKLSGMNSKNMRKLCLYEGLFSLLTVLVVGVLAMLAIGQLVPAFALLRNDYVLAVAFSMRFVWILSVGIAAFAILYVIGVTAMSRQLKCGQDLNLRDMQ